ncbi:hypothetical protein V6N13_029412 [Hibiscus sabdariffa]
MTCNDHVHLLHGKVIGCMIVQSKLVDWLASVYLRLAAYLEYKYVSTSSGLNGTTATVGLFLRLMLSRRLSN